MTRFNNDFKEKVVLRYSEGESVMDISDSTGVGMTTIYEWINKANAIPISGAQKKIREQNKKIVRLETMLSIIKQCDFYKEVPLNQRLKIIDEIYEEYGINVSCDALDVSHGTFHNHQKRGKGDDWLHEKRKRVLLPEILKIDEEFNHTYGSDKITAELINRGIHTCKKTVLKIMKEEGIESIRSSAEYYRKEHLKSGKTNLLKRDFKTDAPNKAWVSDVTYLRIDDRNNTTCFLCVIMDLFSRKIIAHSVGESNNARLLNATLRKAITNRDIYENLILHSDRGANYISKSFESLLLENKITHSFSKAGMPYDNSVIESFFHTFKIECFYRYHFKSKKALIEQINDYIAFYNERRSLSYLNYKSPNQFESEFNENQK